MTTTCVPSGPARRFLRPKEGRRATADAVTAVAATQGDLLVGGVPGLVSRKLGWRAASVAAGVASSVGSGLASGFGPVARGVSFRRSEPTPPVRGSGGGFGGGFGGRSPYHEEELRQEAVRTSFESQGDMRSSASSHRPSRYPQNAAMSSSGGGGGGAGALRASSGMAPPVLAPPQHPNASSAGLIGEMEDDVDQGW